MFNERTPKLTRLLLAPIVIYATWLGMLALHELGHILHAWLSGGRIAKISLPLFGFSQTIIWPNPHELFVVWGGAVWGSVVPLFVALVSKRAMPFVSEAARFFAGFCLIANGAYIGAGAFIRTGDAANLIRLGTPRLLMVMFGFVAFTTGLILWHHSRWLTMRPGIRKDFPAQEVS